MKPVCCGLDILQAETSVGLGFPLPTLTVMKAQLTALLNEQTANDRLNIWTPLASCLISAINSRFAAMFDSTDAQMAAVVNPKFNLDWYRDGKTQTLPHFHTADVGVCVRVVRV